MGGEELNFFQSLAQAFQDSGVSMHADRLHVGLSRLAVLVDRIIALYFRDSINKEAFMPRAEEVHLRG